MILKNSFNVFLNIQLFHIWKSKKSFISLVKLLINICENTNEKDIVEASSSIPFLYSNSNQYFISIKTLTIINNNNFFLFLLLISLPNYSI